VDAVEPAQWKYESIYPGLGDIDREVRAGGVLIAYNHGEALSTKDGTQLTASLEKRLSEPLELRQLASLLQEDVSFETSGARVPRLAGAVSASLQLTPASREESTRKIKQVCSAASEQTATKVALVSSGSEAGSSDAAVTAATGSLEDSDAAVTVAAAIVGDKSAANSSPFSWFFCPSEAEPEQEEAVRPARPAVRRGPRNERPTVVTRYREPREREPRAGRFAYHSGGGGGGGGMPAEVRAAVPGG
jgi:hypothetical protein